MQLLYFQKPLTLKLPTYIVYYRAKHFVYRAAWCSGNDPDLNGRFESQVEYQLP